MTKKETSAYNKAYLEANREALTAKKTARRRHLKKDKLRAVDILIKRYEGTPCMDCDGVFEWCSMDFDHRPEEIKEINIAPYAAQKATPTNMAKIEKEIAKCDLICSNCHRVRTRDRHEQTERSV